MNIMNYEDFKTTDEHDSFISNNPKEGTLKVMVFTASQAIPIENTEITITKDIGNNKVLFFRGLTNESGVIDNIKLPAPNSNSEEKFASSNYTLYDLNATSTSYEVIKKYTVAMFGDIKIIQYVKMTPNINVGGV